MAFVSTKKHGKNREFKMNGKNFRGGNYDIFIFLPPFSMKVNSLKKEFAPLGANSFS